MHIVLAGKLTEEIGGISFFKHTFDIDWAGDVKNENQIFSVPIGPAKINGGVSVAPESQDPSFDNVIVHLDLVLLGFPAYSINDTLAKHIAAGLTSINVSHGQIQFVGSITISG